MSSPANPRRRPSVHITLQRAARLHRDLRIDVSRRERDDPGLVDDLTQAVKRFERRHIERLLRQSPDKKEAAKRLGIGLSSLYRKIDELNVETPIQSTRVAFGSRVSRSFR